jgi:hypothetical protein
MAGTPQSTECSDGHWRAAFYMTGMAHSIVGGSAWEQTPWRAVHVAAWAALSKYISGDTALKGVSAHVNNPDILTATPAGCH